MMVFILCTLLVFLLSVVSADVSTREEGVALFKQGCGDLQKATRQVLCALPHCGQLGGRIIPGFSPTACFLLLLGFEAMLFEKALPLFAAIIAIAGEIKQVTILVMLM